MTTLKLSIIQSHTIWHDPAANRKLFSNLILNHQESTDLYLLPEVFTSGFTLDVAPYAETMDGPTVTAMKQWSQQTNAAIMGSLLVRDEDKIFNRLVCTFPDGKCLHYDKRHLFKYSQEDKIVSGGKKRLIFEWRNWKICPLICYDLRFPVWARNNDHYDLLIYVANWPAVRSFAWTQLLKARAIENQTFVAGVNRIGKDGRDLFYNGNSVLLDYKGEELLHCGDKAGIYTSTIDKASIKDYRKQFPFLQDQDSFSIKT